MNKNCPVCESELIDICNHHGGDPRDKDYHCPQCGKFSLSGTLVATIHSKLDTTVKKAILSHAIRKMQRQQKWPFLTHDVVTKILEDQSLPQPHEQVDNLIRWLGDNLSGPGEEIRINHKNHQAILGAVNQAGFGFIIDYMHNHDLIEGDLTKDRGILHEAEITLIFDGWDRYESIKRGSLDSQTAFMAMQFNDSELDIAYLQCFKPAVEQTGFNLVRLDEQPIAGLIDDQLRVKILTARFLVADLTHGNQGVYWEAGFAEGLGKPVIYTCEKRFFNREDPYSEMGGVHFDANHHLTVIWEEKDLEKAADILKATIRATLPESAKMEDD